MICSAERVIVRVILTPASSYLQPFITLGHVTVSWDLDKHLPLYKIYLEHSETFTKQCATDGSISCSLITLHNSSLFMGLTG